MKFLHNLKPLPIVINTNGKPGLYVAHLPLFWRWLYRLFWGRR
jgi:hypothetical protein